MKKRIESELRYNNKSYGKGKAYIAEIIGENKRFGFDRFFVSRAYEYNCTSATVWYKYEWSVESNKVYEWHEENNYKTKRVYFSYDEIEDDIIYLSRDEVFEYINKFKLV